MLIIFAQIALHVAIESAPRNIAMVQNPISRAASVSGKPGEIPLGRSFAVDDLGQQGVPRLSESELRRVTAVRAALPKGDRQRLLFAFVRFQSKVTFVMFLRATHADQAPRILGGCNLFFGHGAAFAGPPEDMCRNWKPSAADRAAGLGNFDQRGQA